MKVSSGQATGNSQHKCKVVMSQIRAGTVTGSEHNREVMGSLVDYVIQQLFSLILCC
jgi:hypothetical protein